MTSVDAKTAPKAGAVAFWLAIADAKEHFFAVGGKFESLEVVGELLRLALFEGPAREGCACLGKAA